MTAPVALLVNPTAGAGRGQRAAVRGAARLRERGVPVRLLVGRSGTHATELARAAVADGVRALLVAGGDGTSHLAAQVLAGTEVPLGVLPAGSGNDAARMLGLPRDSAAAAADVIADALHAGRTRHLDLAAVSTAATAARVITVLATGFDAAVNERATRMRRLRGRARDAAAVLAELRDFTSRPYLLELDGVRLELEAMLVAVGNGPSYGGGLQICAGADPEDGLLDVVVIEAMTRRELVRVAPRLLDGSHTGHRAYQHHRVRTARVEAPHRPAYGDGERLGELPVTVAVEPAALRVLVPCRCWVADPPVRWRHDLTGRAVRPVQVRPAASVPR